MTYTSTYLFYMKTHVNSKTNTNHQNIRMHVFPDTKSTNLHSHLCVRFVQRNPVHMQECIHGPAVSSRLYINKDYCYSIFAYTRASDASSYLQIRKYACHSHGHAYLCVYIERPNLRPCIRMLALILYIRSPHR